MELYKINQKYTFIDAFTHKLIFGIVIEIDIKKVMVKLKDSKGNIHILIG